MRRIDTDDIIGVLIFGGLAAALVILCLIPLIMAVKS